MSAMDKSPAKPERYIMITYLDPEINGALKAFLEKEGYGVYICPTFDEYASGDFYPLDVVMLDITEADEELLHQISMSRKMRPEVAILATSDRFDTDNIVGALNAGAADYMVRPYSHREILDRLRRLISQ